MSKILVVICLFLLSSLSLSSLPPSFTSTAISMTDHHALYTRFLQSEASAEEEASLRKANFAAHVASVLANAAAFVSNSADSARKRKAPESNHAGRPAGTKTKRRERTDMSKYLGGLDDRAFRRKYRMDKQSFFDLLDIIKGKMPSDGTVRKRGATPNGAITHVHRLSMALRYFAGGDPTDIADIHGVHDNEVLNSVWEVVDAIHQTSSLDIKFPESRFEQAEIARGFKRKSSIGIDCCVGAIDGILIWIHKPSDSDAESIGFGPIKFFCGRKKKYGLNMQGVCDANGYFLDVEIRFPGAASDFYAFDESALKKKLEESGFLKSISGSSFATTYCLFGDNAYVQSPYMVVPWRKVGAGAKDAYNFYQSQLRINIECAFGMLVHRWGMLRKPVPNNITVLRTTRLVLALCKLHNYCITRRVTIDRPQDGDVSNIVLDGGLALPRFDQNSDAAWEYDNEADRLNGILDGGQHTDDHTRAQREEFSKRRGLPAQFFLNFVKDNGLRRPDRSTFRRL